MDRFVCFQNYYFQMYFNFISNIFKFTERNIYFQTEILQTTLIWMKKKNNLKSLEKPLKKITRNGRVSIPLRFCILHQWILKSLDNFNISFVISISVKHKIEIGILSLQLYYCNGVLIANVTHFQCRIFQAGSLSLPLIFAQTYE